MRLAISALLFTLLALSHGLNPLRSVIIIITVIIIIISPECVSLSGVRVQVEQLHPPSLVADVPHPGGAAHRLAAIDDDAQVAAEHAQSLETVRPDHSLKSNC